MNSPSLWGEFEPLPSLRWVTASCWGSSLTDGGFPGCAEAPPCCSCFDLASGQSENEISAGSVQRDRTDRSTRKAYSIIFTRLSKSILMFSNDRRSPSRSAIRA